MANIVTLNARQVFDSRGYPTIEVDITLAHGGYGRFITPSGASVGKKEALELRDNDHNAFDGRGVSQALSNIRGEISAAILNRTFNSINDLDQILINIDGTTHKTRLGANAILAVSGAFFHALAHEQHRALYLQEHNANHYVMPLPLVNVINGGAHANNGLDVQEFMLMPHGAKTFSMAMKMVAECFYALKKILRAEGLSTAVGDEGGFAPELKNNEHALSLLLAAIDKAGYKAGYDISIGLDVAANEIFDKEQKKYLLDQQLLTTSELEAWYQEICRDYPVISLEDPFHEDDVEGFAHITNVLGEHVQIVGDDLFTTNVEYIRAGIEHRYANAVLIKMNQIGTISETIAAVNLSMSAGLRTIMSHRSGETEDCTIADLSVLLATGQIKTGSMSRSERVAKYNRLLRIEEELGSRAVFSPWYRS